MFVGRCNPAANASAGPLDPRRSQRPRQRQKQPPCRGCSCVSPSGSRAHPCSSLSASRHHNQASRPARSVSQKFQTARRQPMPREPRRHRDASGTDRANRQSRQREPALRWPALLRWDRTRCLKRLPSPPLYHHRRAQILSLRVLDESQSRKSWPPAYPQCDV